MPSFNKFTTKAQEALQGAQDLAFDRGVQVIEPLHLLASLLQQEDGVVVSIFKKLGVDVRALLQHALSHLPSGKGQDGGTAQVGIAQTLDRTVRAAHKIAEQFKDEYVST